jgi:hypothetical protein
MTHQWLVCGRKACSKRRNLDGGSKAKNHRQGKNCCMNESRTVKQMKKNRKTVVKRKPGPMKMG